MIVFSGLIDDICRSCGCKLIASGVSIELVLISLAGATPGFNSSTKVQENRHKSKADLEIFMVDKFLDRVAGIL